MRLRLFYKILYVVTALAHLPFAVGVQDLVAQSTLSERTGWGVAAGASLLGVAGFYGRLALARWDHHISRARRYLLEEPYFIHWCAALLSLPLAIVLWPVAALVGARFGRPPLAEACLAAYAGSLPFAAWGVVVRRRLLRVRRLEVPIRGLGAAFDGYRVAQLSDLHVGSMCPRERVERWVARTNALDVDLVVLTGDYITSGVRFHNDIAMALGQLRARDGVLAIMGNHDYYGDGEPLMSLLAERGIVLLRNEHTVIRRGDAELAVVGVDDRYTQRIDIDAAMSARDASLPTVVLAHDPRAFPELAERGAALVLSGHTHWGQVGVPFFAEHLNYARMVARYHAGRYQLGDATLYVHPGMGTTGPPVRLGTWPEIAVLRLRAEGRAASGKAARNQE